MSLSPLWLKQPAFFSPAYIRMQYHSFGGASEQYHVKWITVHKGDYSRLEKVFVDNKWFQLALGSAWNFKKIKTLMTSQIIELRLQKATSEALTWGKRNRVLCVLFSCDQWVSACYCFLTAWCVSVLFRDSVIPPFCLSLILC